MATPAPVSCSLPPRHGTFPSYCTSTPKSLMFPYLHQLGTGMGLGRTVATPLQLRRIHRNRIARISTARPEPPRTRSGPWERMQQRWAARSTQTSSTTRRSSCRRNDFVDNLIYRFGKNESQRLQFFIQDQDDQTNARLWRFSVSAVYLRRYHVGQMLAVSDHRS